MELTDTQKVALGDAHLGLTVALSAIDVSLSAKDSLPTSSTIEEFIFAIADIMMCFGEARLAMQYAQQQIESIIPRQELVENWWGIG